MDIAGKRILITHPLISNIMGSTMMVLELAEELAEMGSSVTIYTAAYSNVARPLFEAIDADVIVDGDERSAGVSLEDYDLVWVNSQLLPPSFVRELADLDAQATGEWKLPLFVFNHMSPLATAPDEHPYIPGLEGQLTSCSAFVSQECMDALSPYFCDSNRLNHILYPNPVPKAFHKVERDRPNELRRVLVVSNHMPEEVIEACELLEARGIDVEVFGDGYGRQAKRVMSEDIAGCDAVITIGKTVQYCLVSGTPVFVYDHFGGWGYLCDDNFAAAAYSNFSGRGADWRMAPDELCEAVCEGFDTAAAWHEDHKDEFRSRYSIPDSVSRVFAMAEENPVSNPGEDMAYWMAVEDQMAFAFRYYRAWDFENWVRLELSETTRQRDRMTSECERLSRDNESLQRDVESRERALREQEARIEELEQQARALQSKIDEIYASKSWRLGNAVMRVPAGIRDAIRNG